MFGLGSLIPRGWAIVFLLVLVTNSEECYAPNVVDYDISYIQYMLSLTNP
jgi:hypothetical protein